MLLYYLRTHIITYTIPYEIIDDAPDTPDACSNIISYNRHIIIIIIMHYEYSDDMVYGIIVVVVYCTYVQLVSNEKKKAKQFSKILSLSHHSRDLIYVVLLKYLNRDSGFQNPGCHIHVAPLYVTL